MIQMRDYPAWYLCQNHSKNCQNVPKSQKLVRTPHQIWPTIWESDRKCALNLSLNLRKLRKFASNFEKCQKVRLKSDLKNPTLPRAQSHNLSSYTTDVNSVVLRNVNGVFYAKMGSKWVDGDGLIWSKPLQKVSRERILTGFCVHSNKVEPTNGPYQVRSASSLSRRVGTERTQSLDWQAREEYYHESTKTRLICGPRHAWFVALANSGWP